MMAAKKQTVTDEKDARRVRSIRKDAKKEIVRSQKPSTDMKAQTPEALICELRIKLDKQAEELRKIQLVLEESRDKYLDLYEFAPLGYLTLNDKALITEVNLAGAMLLGADRNDIINHGLDQFLTHGDLEIWNRFFTDLRRHVKKPVCTLTLTRGDGSVFPARLEGVRTTDCEGAFGVHIAISDITDMRNAEEALRESEEKYRSIFNNFPDLYYQTDLNGIITRLSPSLTRLSGWVPEDLIGHLTTELYAFPEERDGLIETLLRKGEVQNYEITLLHKDGRHLMTSISGHLLFDDAGKPTVIEGTIRDISERKKAEEALRKSENKYRKLVETTDTGFVIIDDQGRVLDANLKYISLTNHTSLEEIAGRNVTEWTAAYEKDKNAEAVQQCVRDGYMRSLEIDYVNASGTIIPIEINSTVVRSDEGVQILTLCRDISDRKRAENAIRQANKKLNLLSSITRHDINNQLTVIGGYMDIIECKEHDPTIDEFFQTVSTATQRIAALIQFIGEYEQIGVTAPVWQDCRTLVDTAAKEAPLGKIMVKNDLPAGIEVFADPLIAKVCYNLIDNAVRYGGKITTIRFFAEEAGDNHVIVCEDDGEGVVAEEKEKIFERGFGKNTGLGLALSREILDITGITFRETGEPGKGARFEMTVPKGAWR